MATLVYSKWPDKTVCSLFACVNPYAGGLSTLHTSVFCVRSLNTRPQRRTLWNLAETVEEKLGLFWMQSDYVWMMFERKVIFLFFFVVCLWNDLSAFVHTFSLSCVLERGKKINVSKHTACIKKKKHCTLYMPASKLICRWFFFLLLTLFIIF